ncbi:MAG: hypothetical protein SGI77_26190 [Pirellulaceae bacterium]|nr:hypothetical protein [Pirellulaceae bacterium]
MRPLIEKELRENLKWLPVGLLVFGVALAYCVIPGGSKDYSATESTLSASAVMIGSLFALALGVAQSAFDVRTASKSYLWHRAVTPRAIFYSKLIAGGLIYAIAALVPLAITAAWFGSQGIRFAPVRPLQVVPAMIAALACFSLHPAAIFMMVRSARWFGTKLFPVFGVLPVLLIPMIEPFPESILISYLFATLAILVCIAIVAKAAENAWCKSVASDEGATESLQDWTRTTVLCSAGAVAFIIGFGFLGMFLSSLFSGNIIPSSYPRYGIDAAGRLWYGQHVSSSVEGGILKYPQFISGSIVQEGKVPNPYDELAEKKNKKEILPIYQLGRYQGGRILFQAASQAVIFGVGQRYFDHRGFVLFYNFKKRPALQSIISRDSSHLFGEAVGKPFDGNPIRSHGMMKSSDMKLNDDQNMSLRLQEIWVDQNGVYHFNGKLRTIQALAEMKIEDSALIRTDQVRGELRLMVVSAGKLHLYEVHCALKKNREAVAFVDESGPPTEFEVSLEKIAVLLKLPRSLDNCQIGITEDRKIVSVCFAPQPTVSTLDCAAGESEWNTWTFQKPPADRPDVEFNDKQFKPLVSQLPSIVVGTCYIGSALAGETYIRSWSDLMYYVNQITTFMVLATIGTILAMIVTFWVAQHRRLSTGLKVRWTLWAIFLGWGTPLAIIAAYVKPRTEPCSRCGKTRRIDLSTCEHCRAEWEPPANEGIEICDDGFQRTSRQPANA